MIGRFPCPEWLSATPAGSDSCARLTRVANELGVAAVRPGVRPVRLRPTSNALVGSTSSGGQRRRRAAGPLRRRMVGPSRSPASCARRRGPAVTDDGAGLVHTSCAYCVYKSRARLERTPPRYSFVLSSTRPLSGSLFSSFFSYPTPLLDFSSHRPLSRRFFKKATLVNDRPSDRRKF